MMSKKKIDVYDRAYNSFEINKKTKASIIKTSDEDRLFGEMNYYKNLPDELKIYFPRLLKCKPTPRYSWSFTMLTIILETQ